MNKSVTFRACLGCLIMVGGSVGLTVGLVSCGSAPTAFVVQGIAPTGNTPPVLTIIRPDNHLTRGRGEPFTLGWTDSDGDNNAMISFSLVNTLTNAEIPLVESLDENDNIGLDSISIDTTTVPVGTYNIRGIIDDSVNPPVEAFAQTTSGPAVQRVILTIVEPGQGPPTVPPVVTVTEPSFNLSVAQDDVLHVVVQPTAQEPEAGVTRPFDPDSDVTLFLVLDTDQNPNNDEPANPDPDEIIFLRQQSVAAGSTAAITFDIPIDLSQIPPRPNGEPYFIRATVDDFSNPRVHQYAVGTISVVQLASGEVDLFNIGKTTSGAIFQGFNPGARLGSTIANVTDFDADGIDDFVMVAQFGNPRNLGLLGEAYLVYGRDQIRFGGTLPVNSISDTISGVIFEAPPIRNLQIASSDPRTDGISDVSFVRDLSQDGRPELLFGLQHVHGAFDGMDYDPTDADLTTEDNTVEINVAIRQGDARVTVGEEDPDIDRLYAGVQDLTIDSEFPNTGFGSDADLTWRNAGAGQRAWTLLKFRDVLEVIPDGAGTIDISTVSANLTVRVFRTAADGNVREVLTDFDEQATFATFAVNGGEPEAGVDYAEATGGQGDLGTVDGATAQVVTVDVSDLVRRLIDGELRDSSDNELRFIVLPTDDEGADLPTSIRSSEFSIEADRPTLNITYTRTNFIGSRGCYPDDLVNNSTDSSQVDPFDIQFFGGGIVAMVNSQNRDNSPRLPFDQAPRLDTTSISLELAGQESGRILDADGLNREGGGIFARADDGNEENRIAGARFTAGGFDFVDHRSLRQPPREGLFGQTVASIGDLNNDDLDEIIISAPLNERHVQDLFDTDGFQSTHWRSTTFSGSIVVIPGTNYDDTFWRELGTTGDSNSTIPTLDQQRFAPFGSCNEPRTPRKLLVPADSFEVFAEDIDDQLGGASSAGDFNQDGIDDIVCGAPRNDRSAALSDTGAAYVLYGRTVLGNYNLTNADDPALRPPMLRIRGVKPGDRIGTVQSAGLDVNGDRIDDIFIASPSADFGGVTRSTCAADFNGDGSVNGADLDALQFNSCRNTFGAEVFSDDSCKAFDYNNDRRIDDDDDAVFRCLLNGGGNACCANVVDNGFVGIVFGGVLIDGDRTIDQIATTDVVNPDLPGVVFFGAASGHRAGTDVSSAGDFNQDGFGDILIAVPGERRLDRAGRERVGVVYLVFGGTHLKNKRFNLSQVGSRDLPGIIFLSPYVKGRPNEAPPTAVAALGDVNSDGFGDIAIGNPTADFIDTTFPQGPDATDSELGRRSNAGDVYIVYGSNFGSNRVNP